MRAGGSSKRKPAGRKAAAAEPSGSDGFVDLVDGSSGEEDQREGEEPSQPPSVSAASHCQALNFGASLTAASQFQCRGLQELA